MTIRKELPFDQVNALALGQYPALLFTWFPNGTLVDGQKEFAIGDLAGTAGGKDGGSVKVKIRSGWWAEMNGGEPKGKDPISLYAWAFCGGDRVRACKELGASLGVPGCNPPRGAEVVPFPVKNPPRTAPKEEWRPMVPPPDDVPGPNVTGYDHVFIYRNQAGQLLRYVVRRDADKYIRAITYGYLKNDDYPNGKTAWHIKQPDSPRSLYGLERLSVGGADPRDGRPVILQEGELKTDLVAALLPGYACLSLTGGTGGKNHNDLAPLARRVVFLVPDADASGRDAMREIARQLRELGATVQLIDTTGYPDKWDLGNAVTGKMPDGSQVEPWDAARLEAFLKERAVDDLPDPESGDDLEGDPDEEWKEDGGQRDKRTMPPMPLGYDSGHYYYLSPMTGQIEALARRAHTQHELVGIASLQWFNTLDQFKTDKGKLNWTEVGDMLKGWCSDVGFFQPDRVRGRGAWLEDDGRAVLHLGDRLLVDGESLPLKLPGSRYFYEAARPLKCAVAEPATKEQAAELLEICKLFRWEKDISGTLMAGWIVTAIICGALFWRPAIWVTGGSGSGKSTLEKLVVRRILGGIGLFKMAGTTEAGIRQELNRDARPVVFDEAESETAKAKGIMQGLLDLNRQSSSENGAEITKGTQNQTGAKKYHVRSSFMFSSINPMLQHLADESRISVLELRNPVGRDAAARAGFDELVARIERTITPEFAASLIARAVKLMPFILGNAETFSRAVAVHLGSSRVGDQVGTLLAGAFACMSDKAVSPEAARKWVEDQKWEDTTSADAERDEQRLVNFLFQQNLTVKVGGSPYDRTIGALILAANGGDRNMGHEVAAEVLLAHGFKFDGKEGGVWIANKHAALADFLKDTAWAAGHHRALRRVDGARDSGKAVWFGVGAVQRAVFVPVDLTNQPT